VHPPLTCYPIKTRFFSYIMIKNCLTGLLFLHLWHCHFSTYALVQGDKYLQELKEEIVLPPDADKNVIRLLAGKQENIVAVTSNGVFRYHAGKWKGKAFGSDWTTAVADVQGDVWLTTGSYIQKENATNKIALPESAKADTITSLFWEDSKTLFVGTSNGLLSYDGNWKTVAATSGKHVYDLTKDADKNLWAATNDGLLYRKDGKWVNLDDNLMALANKRTYFSLGTANHNADLLYGGIKSVGCIAADGNHWIARGPDGLPYGPARVIRTFGSTIWYGTDKGAIKKDEKWHYYNGKRWLPDNKVNDILPITPETVWIATPQGISQIRLVEMTLEDKARVFEERIQKRHFRHGLVARSKLTIAGDLASNHLSHTANDGLWTAIYLAAQSFRYAVTKDPVAKKSAEDAFVAMERLEKVTGIPGFPARTIVAPEEEAAKTNWKYSADKKWKWLGDTSSDEMIGHMFAYPIFHELVANDTTKANVEALVTRILDHMIKNNYQMVDQDGKATRWGIWNPDSLNLYENWWYERGTNSTQILSFLQAGYTLTRQQRFADAAVDLAKKHGYAENMVQAKKYGPFEINFVDNQLSFFPYYVLGIYSKDPAIKPYLEKSLRRAWSVVRKDRTPMWNVIASAVLGEKCDMDIARAELETIPMDMIMWSMENSHRWDLIADPLTDRMGERQSMNPIPTAERGVTKWNINPYKFDSNTGGKEENDGAYFLLAYWMGRYHGYWK